MICLDSSAWIELLTDGRRAKQVAKQMLSEQVVVPTLVLFEVYRHLTKVGREAEAMLSTGLLSRHHVQDLTREIALNAADLSLELQLPMADSIVLATARAHSAPLITLDNDFADVDGAVVIRPRA